MIKDQDYDQGHGYEQNSLKMSQQRFKMNK